MEDAVRCPVKHFVFYQAASLTSELLISVTASALTDMVSFAFYLSMVIRGFGQLKHYSMKENNTVRLGSSFITICIDKISMIYESNQC